MEILTHPNPALKLGAADVDPATDTDLLKLVEIMARAMYAAPGIGLAAPQVGVLKRVIVFDLDDGLVALCNPRIIETSEETELSEEGCLSLPGIGVQVERPVAVTCEAMDLKGRTVRVEGNELLARLLQHEIDHLDGVLIIDRASPDERRAAMKAYREAMEAPDVEQR
ncbi:MAG: peptide deformylase [Coriobacteriia bacterium]|nr:peptide deformylase [Coriobacteriia bacterium]